MFEMNSDLNTPRLKVMGIGGAGLNAVNTMISCKLCGVDCIVADTDPQALGNSLAPSKLQLGTAMTKEPDISSNPVMGGKADLETVSSPHSWA